MQLCRSSPPALVQPALPRRCRPTRPLSTVLVALGASFAFASLADAQSTSPLPFSVAAVQAAAHPYAAYVAEASQRFGIPEAWIWAVMRVESAGDPRATSHAGAMGLMQVMPGTYAELRARYDLGPDAYDPRDSILAGTAYLREMHDRYGSAGFLAAYNAGPGRWEDYRDRGRPLPAETIAYITRLGLSVGSAAAVPQPSRPLIDRFAWTRAALFVRSGPAASSPVADPPNGLISSPESEAALEANSTLAVQEYGRAGTTNHSPTVIFAIRRPQ